MSGHRLSERFSDPTFRQFLRFLATGVVNTAFGLAVYSVLVWGGVAPQPALAIAFVIGVIWNYFTHAKFVFGQRGFRRLPAYCVAYLAVYAVNSLALRGLIDLGISPVPAQALLSPFAAVLSFLAVGRALTGRFPLPSR